jgi:nondiscriminating glutamyl-tRNA synthetase
MNVIRVRFAPSPTGFLHIGSLRTALYDYLFAKKYNGILILRIEDTDQSREVDGAVDNLLKSFGKLDIHFDEGPHIGGDFGPYVQSERLEIYKKFAYDLVEKGCAYPCFCSADTLETMRKDLQDKNLFPKYDRRCLKMSKDEIKSRIDSGDSYVLRLKMPDKRTFRIDDEIRGTVDIDTNQMDDQVLLKSDGFPTYHLAAVVDDHLMQISHVIRGEEWLSSTPKHIFLYECLGWTPPKWVHLPLILNPDRSKLSKRMNDVSVDSYLNKGYLKESLINFIALLGWHGADDREIYSLQEVCHEFSLDRVNKAGAIFDLTKLDWMNGQYIRSLPVEYIADLCRVYFNANDIDISDPVKYMKTISTGRNYITVLPDIVSQIEVYYNNSTPVEGDLPAIQEPNAKILFSWYINHLQNMHNPDKDTLTELVKVGMDETGIKGKQYFHPLRIALFYKGSGPDIPTLIDTLGLELTIQRLKTALNYGN